MSARAAGPGDGWLESFSDSILDSYVFLDDFRWGCEPVGEPQTEPEG